MHLARACFRSRCQAPRSGGQPLGEELILHGDVDQIVPIGNAYRSAKLIANATLKEYPGAPHALIATSKDEINKDLLAFIQK